MRYLLEVYGRRTESNRSFSEKYTVIVWKVYGLLNYTVLDFANYTVLKLKQYGLLKLFGSTNES